MLRTRTVCCTAALALCLTSAAGAATRADRESALVQAVNETRVAHGLRPLQVDARLELAARAHSEAMLRRDVLWHGALRARLASFDARGPAFGENLAWGVGPTSAADAIVRMWLASSGHRANLLRPGFRRVGIGAPVGTFAGHPGATVVTADFAGS
jgi:uncharacterized protein YkwD